MKVPIRYKSSDRYNAGVDVVYDDESKLQYAPFVYATTDSGDNGGEDEEGEDSMLVVFNQDTGLLDKTYNEIVTAISNGSLVYVGSGTLTGSTNDDYTIWYIVNAHYLEGDSSFVLAGASVGPDGVYNTSWHATAPNEYPQVVGD